ncbi:peptidoglycan-binding domain-containing protein [Kitasatospora sp. NPDC094015]|uniref:peptidoglycan-binding domain-containing protein n=1 Tax=Kitasatospora sp. NPDC094015 TaxID=3155205 RepID=UPI003318B37B
MHDSVRDGFNAFSEPLESREHMMYLDVKSLVSTGVGNLLDADDPANFGSNPVPLPDIFTLDWHDRDTAVPADRTAIEEEYRKIKFSGTANAPIAQKRALGQLLVSDGSVDALITAKLDSFETSLRGRPPFAGYDGWPAPGQLGLLSMAWAMGPMFRFPHFEAAAAGGDRLTMARECRMTEAGNSGVIPRNVRNALLFTLAGWVTEQGGDIGALVYDPTQPLNANLRSGALPVPLNLLIGVQTALETLGFDPHGLDGIAGPGTRGALTAFQGANGLTVTPAVNGIDDVPEESIAALAAQLDARGLARFP